MVKVTRGKKKDYTTSPSANTYHLSTNLVNTVKPSINKFSDHQGVVDLHEISEVIKQCEHYSKYNNSEVSSNKTLVETLPNKIKN